MVAICLNKSDIQVTQNKSYAESFSYLNSLVTAIWTASGMSSLASILYNSLSLAGLRNERAAIAAQGVAPWAHIITCAKLPHLCRQVANAAKALRTNIPSKLAKTRAQIRLIASGSELLCTGDKVATIVQRLAGRSHSVLQPAKPLFASLSLLGNSLFLKTSAEDLRAATVLQSQVKIDDLRGKKIVNHLIVRKFIDVLQAVSVVALAVLGLIMLTGVAAVPLAVSLSFALTASLLGMAGQVHEGASPVEFPNAYQWYCGQVESSQ